MGKRSPRAAMAALGLLFPAHVRAIGPKSVYIMLQIGVFVLVKGQWDHRDLCSNV